MAAGRRDVVRPTVNAAKRADVGREGVNERSETACVEGDRSPAEASRGTRERERRAYACEDKRDTQWSGGSAEEVRGGVGQSEGAAVEPHAC